MQNRDGEAILKVDTHSCNDLSHDHVDCDQVVYCYWVWLITWTREMPSDRFCTFFLLF